MSKYIYDYDEEDESYKKHPKSNKEHTKKSKHKHKYIECMFILDQEDGKMYKGSVCTLCGKVEDISFRSITDAVNLPKYHLNYFLDKYVKL